MGKLAEIKTKQTTANVADFIDSITDEQKRKDSHVILKVMEKVMKEKPKMWGSSIIGFGNKRYNITIYLIDMRPHADALVKLGKHKMGGGCLYINKLADVDIKVLEKMIAAAAK